MYKLLSFILLKILFISSSYGNEESDKATYIDNSSVKSSSIDQLKSLIEKKQEPKDNVTIIPIPKGDSSNSVSVVPMSNSAVPMPGSSSPGATLVPPQPAPNSEIPIAKGDSSNSVSMAPIPMPGSSSPGATLVSPQPASNNEIPIPKGDSSNSVSVAPMSNSAIPIPQNGGTAKKKQEKKTENNQVKIEDVKEEEIIIEEVILNTELQERPIYDHKTVTLSPNVSKKQYGQNNKHLPKAFYQSEYTELLFDAVRSNDIQGIKSLIEKGANINAQEISSGYTPVMYAVKYNRIKALRALIIHGADLKKTNLQGQTALHIAAGNGNAQAIEVLMSGGIDPTVKDKKGKRASDYMKPNMQSSAMIMASNYQDKTKALIDFVGLGSYDAVNYALSNGAKIDARDDIGSDGDTPLIIAIKCQDKKMVSLLLNSGASLVVTNKRGKLPIQVAIDLQNNEIANILRTVKINRELASAVSN